MDKYTIEFDRDELILLTALLGDATPGMIKASINNSNDPDFIKDCSAFNQDTFSVDRLYNTLLGILSNEN